MKRTLIVAAIAAGAAFCLGAAVRPKLKFPWASAALNKTVTMTVLEKTLLEKGHFRATEPIVRTVGTGRQKIVVSVINRMTPTIITSGIRVDVDLQVRDGNRSQMRSSVIGALRLARQRWVAQTRLSRLPIWIRLIAGKKVVGVMEDDQNYTTAYDKEP